MAFFLVFVAVGRDAAFFTAFFLAAASFGLLFLIGSGSEATLAEPRTSFALREFKSSAVVRRTLTFLLAFFVAVFFFAILGLL
jgi:hypothetical protein